MLIPLLFFMGLGLCVSLAVTGFALLLRISDTPNARSSHHKVTPTGGGLGIVAGTLITLAALAYFSPSLISDHTQLFLLVGIGMCVAALGLFDDLFDLPSGLKFFIIALISLATPLVTGLPHMLPTGPTGGWVFPEALAHIGGALWMFVVINGVNFMDGSNGLLGLSGLAACLGILMVGALTGILFPALLACALAAGLLGFLPYNFRASAQIFSGDVGSLFTGFIIGVTGLFFAAHADGAGLLYAVPLLILPLLTDVLLTMARRLRYKQNLLTAHRSHIYQRLIQNGLSHKLVAITYGMSGMVMVAAVWVGGVTGMLSSPAFFAAWVVLAIVLYGVVAQKVRG